MHDEIILRKESNMLERSCSRTSGLVVLTSFPQFPSASAYLDLSQGLMYTYRKLDFSSLCHESSGDDHVIVPESGPVERVVTAVTSITCENPSTN